LKAGRNITPEKFRTRPHPWSNVPETEPRSFPRNRPAARLSLRTMPQFQGSPEIAGGRCPRDGPRLIGKILVPASREFAHGRSAPDGRAKRIGWTQVFPKLHGRRGVFWGKQPAQGFEIGNLAIENAFVGRPHKRCRRPAGLGRASPARPILKRIGNIFPPASKSFQGDMFPAFPPSGLRFPRTGCRKRRPGEKRGGRPQETPVRRIFKPKARRPRPASGKGGRCASFSLGRDHGGRELGRCRIAGTCSTALRDLRCKTAIDSTPGQALSSRRPSTQPLVRGTNGKGCPNSSIHCLGAALGGGVVSSGCGVYRPRRNPPAIVEPCQQSPPARFEAA